MCVRVCVCVRACVWRALAKSFTYTYVSACINNILREIFEGNIFVIKKKNNHLWEKLYDSMLVYLYANQHNQRFMENIHSRVNNCKIHECFLFWKFIQYFKVISKTTFNTCTSLENVFLVCFIFLSLLLFPLPYPLFCSSHLTLHFI